MQKFICFLGLAFFILSCNKKEQRLVLDSGYEIMENTEPPDYRKVFEGDYLINCYGYSILTNVKLLPTDKKTITFDPLYGWRGTADPEVWAKLSAVIDTSGSFEIPLQKFSLSDSPSAETYSFAGSGTFRSDSSLIVNFGIGGAYNDYCMCSGKRK